MGESNQNEQLKIPPILRPLLESFAREALQNQPADCIEFGRLYFDTFMVHRERSNYIRRVSQDIVEKVQRICVRADGKRKIILQRETQQSTKLKDPEVQKAATKIQAAFRGHRVRVNRDKLVSGNRELDSPDEADNPKDLKRHSVGGYSFANRNNGATPEEKAATKIQAQLRGYLARKHYFAQKQEADAAATKIQAGIRGFLTRKKLVEQESPPRSKSSNN